MENEKPVDKILGVVKRIFKDAKLFVAQPDV